jgi:hypothetical protein
LNSDIKRGLYIDGQWVFEKKSCSGPMDVIPEEFIEFYIQWDAQQKGKPDKPQILINLLWEGDFVSVEKSNNEIQFGDVKIWTWLGADSMILHEFIFENRLSHDIKHGLGIGGQWVLGESNSENFFQSEGFELSEDNPEEIVQFFQEWEYYLQSKPDQPQIEVTMVLDVQNTPASQR